MTDELPNSLPQTESDYLLLHPEDLEGLVAMSDAIDAVEKAYGEAATWPMVNAPRRRIHSPDEVRLSSFPGAVPALGVIGIAERAERVTHDGPIQRTVDNEHPICILHDSRNGRILAILIGSIPEKLVGYTARSALRTGATSGAVFRHMARKNAATCGLIGAGNQAVTQLLALKSVRAIERVYVHTRSHACPYQKSDPNIGMMETTEFRHQRNPAAVMNGPPKWRVFVQPEVGAPCVVVIRVGAK